MEMKNIGFLLADVAAMAWVFTATTAFAQHSHSGTGAADDHGAALVKERGLGAKGEVEFTTETQVGQATLKPGRYAVQHRTNGEGHAMYFTEIATSAHIRESAFNREKRAVRAVVVKCRLEPLGSETPRTLMRLRSEDPAMRLLKIYIRGQSVAHVF